MHYTGVDDEHRCGGTPDDLPPVTRDRDHTGREITEVEPLDKEIMVWEIQPANRRGLDVLWEREYQRAVTLAKEVLTDLVDALEDEEALEKGATVSMKLVKTTLLEYLESTVED